jgi:ribosomal protein S18 acetylase RimI-like enzyme
VELRRAPRGTRPELIDAENIRESITKHFKNTRIGLRVASRDDYALGLELYIKTMKPLLEELGYWHDAKNERVFAEGIRESLCYVITLRGEELIQDIGWLQINVDDEISIKQLHLRESYRNQQIGGQIIKSLIRLSREMGRGLLLAVAKNNRARALYERFGFRILEIREWKVRMRYSGKGS